RRSVSISHAVTDGDGGTYTTSLSLPSLPVTVTDDDSSGVTINESAGSTQVAENGGTDTYTVRLASQPLNSVDVTVTSGASSAATVYGPGGSAATAAASVVLTFTTSNWNSVQTVTVVGVNDDVDNANNRRSVSISHSVTDGDGGAYTSSLSIAGVSVRVTDDDTAGVTITESSGSTSVGENAGEDTYTVELNSQPLNSVTVTVTSGSPAAALVDGPDVTATDTATETLTFSPTNWDRTQTVTVTGVDDLIHNTGDKRSATISHSITDGDGGAYTASLSIASVAVTVTDDDDVPTGVTLTVNKPTVTEDGGAQTVRVTATVDGSSRFAAEQTVTVTVAGSGGTATVGFTPVSSFTVTIPALAASGSQTFTLTPANDIIDETDETITVSGTVAPATGVTVTSATISLTDDDATPTTVNLSVSPVTVAENAVPPQVTVTATVQGSTRFGVTKAVAVSVAGTGQAGRVKFSPVTGFTINIAAGALSAQGTFTLTPTNNIWDEESETVSITGTSGTTTIGSASITLTDDDAAPTGIALTASTTAVNEGDGNTTVTITATVQGATRYGKDTAVTVSVAGSGGSDVVDFAAVSNFTITIPAGALSQTGSFTLTPTDDSTDEYDETITVSGAATGVASIDSETISLADNDATTVTVSAPAGDVAEATGTKDITLTLSRALIAGERVTVPLSVVGASAGDDYAFGLQGANTGVTLLDSGTYTAQNPGLRFASGASAAVLRFDPVDNAVRTQPYVVIRTGSPTGTTGTTFAEPTGGPVAFAILDDETGDIFVAQGWGLKPSQLIADDEFRLVFTTSAQRDASSGTIANYDAFVRALVAEGHADIIPYAGFFKVLASTSAVSLTDHNGVGTNAAVDVYWLGSSLISGGRVANGYAAFRGEWTSQNSPRNEDGTTVSVDSTGYFTGSTSAGAKSSNPLGASNVTLGFLNDSGAGRAPLGSQTFTTQSQTRRFYGLSPVFKVGELPELTITGPSGAVTEGSAGTFTISSDPAATSDLSVNLLVSGGDTFGVSTGIKNGAVTLATGSTSVTYSVATTADAVDEADDSLTVALLGGTGYRLGATSVVTVALNDDDATSLSLESGDTTSINEGSTNNYALSLGRNLGPGETVTARLTFAGTATRGSDYTLACSGVGISCSGLNSGTASVTFTGSNLGAQQPRTATLTLTAVVDDTHPEPSESVNIGVGTVTHTGLSGGVAAPSDTAGSINIVSVVPASVDVSFASDAYTATEASTNRSINVVVNLTPAPTAGITLSYSVTGSASSGTDFTTLTGTVAASAGASTVTIPVTVIDDNIDDDAETIVLTLVDATDYDLGTTSSTTITITDDDSAPTQIILSANPATLAEDGGAAAVGVTATVQGGTVFGTAKTVTVSGARTAGTVGVGAIAPFTITIPAGAQAASTDVTVTPQNDNVDEADATVTFSGILSGVTVSSAALMVTDDDATPTALALSVAPTSISEGATGSARTVTVTATVQGSTVFGTNRTVAVTAAKTSGSVGVSGISPFTITIPSGERAASADVTVAPQNDSTDESDATVTFSGSLGTVTVSSAALLVTDDDGAPTAVSLTVSPTTLAEDAGATTVTVTATVQGASRFGEAKTIAVSVAGSGGANVVAFAAVADFTITIPANAGTGSGSFTLTPTDDSAYQDTETVTVSGTLSDVTVSSAELMLTDNDQPPPAASFASASSSSVEGAGTQTVTVNLSRSLQSDVTLSYHLEGSATLGADYTSPGGTVTVTAGTTSADIDVVLTGDSIPEEAETVVLTLTRGPGSGYTIGNTNAHTLTIIDDDPPPVQSVPTDWALIPSGLSAGDQFRLLFVTSTKTQAASTDITDYNAFVRQRALAGHDALRPYADLFRALASTAAVDAVDNTYSNTGTGPAIHWVGGAKVADNYADF
ncbi:MAG: hypothetical protein F4078_05515, partial [Acidimicrobiia bacterium]|nr:hypothetical protein [Acidimicrobiia bacterium]